jgi:hypothetical protein
MSCVLSLNHLGVSLWNSPVVWVQLGGQGRGDSSAQAPPTQQCGSREPCLLQTQLASVFSLNPLMLLVGICIHIEISFL